MVIDIAKKEWNDSKGWTIWDYRLYRFLSKYLPFAWITVISAIVILSVAIFRISY